ncbi:MAG: hypothetical protein ABIL01_20385, partial [Pseudomonadota bacterium]
MIGNVTTATVITGFMTFGPVHGEPEFDCHKCTELALLAGLTAALGGLNRLTLTIRFESLSTL